MISVIIPVYNEQDAITSTIDRCRKVLDSIGDSSVEIIVVDDSSEDNSYERARATGVKIMSHPHNIGYGRSLKDGISAAVNDIIVITDADGTYPVESIPTLLAEYEKGFNMVVGARKGKYLNESFSKRIFRKILKFMVEFTAGRKIPDINSGLRIFSKKEILPFFNRLCDTFSFTTSLTLAYMMTGKFVKYIPIDYEKRIGKSKVKHFRDSLRTLQYITEAILYYNPIKIFLVFMSILMIVAFLFLAVSFIWQLYFIFLISIGIFMISIIILAFGFIAILLKQILQKNN